jgi:GT2 family glycosyltransferase
MGLTVILLNWRDEQRTLRCAREVAKWELPGQQLIVVDNESTAASRQTLSALPTPVDLISSVENLGFAGGNNLGLRQAQALATEYFVLLNTDAEISATDMRRLIETLDRHPDIAVVGPAVRETGGGGVRYFVGGRDIARYSRSRETVTVERFKSYADCPPRDVAYVSGMALLGRAALLRDVGYLDEDYFFSGEIADFCKRVAERGYRVCVDTGVIAMHRSDETPMRLRETLYTYYSYRNRFLYVDKHHRATRAGYYLRWSIRAGGAAAWALLRCKPTRARSIALAVMDANRGRFGNQNAKFI